MTTAKRGRILASAIRLWRQTHNINKVSLEDIAREAGVSPTTVYNNFGTRDGLVRETVKHLTEAMIDQQRAVVKSDVPFPVKMQGLLAVKMAAIQDMQADLLDRFSNDPVVSRFLDQIYEVELKPMMAEIISDGKRQGYIRPDLPDEVVMLYLDMMKAGGAACAAQLQRVAGEPRLMQALTDIFYYGLFQKKLDVTGELAAGKEAA
ncbi:MAG: TetR/AcrR family transcriptional regulator [Chloroflexi bacterium]|nr:TetR/AcrR family transcriptional regulator [Chloroflexota bacterium]